MSIEFTAHNIRLDDGSYTRPEQDLKIEQHPWFLATRRLLETLYPGDRQKVRVVDLGCLEGGYAVEFARMGFETLGIEIRESNIAACNYVKSRVNLPNLSFAQDNALNVAQYGTFDVVFCCGLFYHLDRPVAFLDTLASVTTKLLILQTHFSTGPVANDKFRLSKKDNHEGVPGQWYTEFPDQKSFEDREKAKWASWDNHRSFWIQREYLLEAVQKAGFPLVMEQFDHLGPDLAQNMTEGFYKTDRRGTFLGLKTSH